MKKLFIILTIVFSFFCSISYAQKAPAKSKTKAVAKVSTKQHFSIGAGYWYTNGELNLNLYADKDTYGIFYYKGGWYYGLVDVKGERVSKLDYDTDAGLFIVNVNAWLWWRFYADASIGWGNIDGGLGDSDWYSQIDANRMHFSKSDAEGDMKIWNINGYLRIIEEPNDKGYLDLSIGYMYYKDDINPIKNGTQILYFWETINAPLTGEDSSDKYKFDGLRLGARAKIRLNKRLAIKASAGVCPWANVNKDQFWNLRNDLGNPPGLKISGSANATMFDCSAGLEFEITKNLFIEAGYKYINLDSDNGNLDWNWVATSGTDIKTSNNWNVNGHRGGFYAMGRVKF